MLRKDKWPELPEGYWYDVSGTRIYLTYPIWHGNVRMRWHMYVPGTTKHQYWTNPYLAAIAAWKHAYNRLKEIPCPPLPKEAQLPSDLSKEASPLLDQYVEHKEAQNHAHAL